MVSATIDGLALETRHSEVLAETHAEKWVHWPIHWSGIWAGALAAIVAVLLFGLIGIAVGAPLVAPEQRVVDLKKITLPVLAFSVFSAFLAFVIGGWVAGKVAGILRSEPAMLHGAIVWLVAVPLLVVMAGLGAGSFLGGWYGGLAGTPSWTKPAGAPYNRPEPLAPNASEKEQELFRAEQVTYRKEVKQWNDEAPQVARNSALGAITALLLGLVASVIGGWMASGEPMNFTHHRNRPKVLPSRIQV
jgi:ABC-type Fe3+ transport system permease subunit